MTMYLWLKLLAFVWVLLDLGGFSEGKWLGLLCPYLVFPGGEGMVCKRHRNKFRVRDQKEKGVGAVVAQTGLV